MKTRVGLGDEILPSYIDYNPGLLHKPIFLDRSMKQPGIYGRSLVGFDFVAPGRQICFRVDLFPAQKSHEASASPTFLCNKNSS